MARLTRREQPQPKSGSAVWWRSLPALAVAGAAGLVAVTTNLDKLRTMYDDYMLDRPTNLTISEVDANVQTDFVRDNYKNLSGVPSADYPSSFPTSEYEITIRFLVKLDKRRVSSKCDYRFLPKGESSDMYFSLFAQPESFVIPVGVTSFDGQTRFRGPVPSEDMETGIRIICDETASNSATIKLLKDPALQSR